MNTLNEHYRPETVLRLKEENKRTLTRLLVWLGLTLCACAALCFGLTPLNSTRRLVTTVAVSSVGGWVALYVLRYGLLRRRHERRHVEWILEQPKEHLEGTVRMTDSVLRLRGSIPVRTVLLEGEDGAKRLKLFDGLSPALRELEGQRVRLDLAGTYITGAEVCHEGA